jgi:DNA-binding response OmpR family regulator
MTASLRGVRVLVVEDEYLVAILIQDILESAGCVVSGPIPRLPEALDAVDHDTYDVAVLDVNLGGERIDPVAKALSRRNVPFVFVTGYGAGVLSGEFAERPRLCKPFKMADLLDALSSIVKPSMVEAAQPA